MRHAARSHTLAVTLAIALTTTLAGCGSTSTQTRAPEQSVAPGINESYLAPDMDPADWTQRFEVESREIYDARMEIVRELDLAPGMAIADVGAGTGLFVEPFAHAVGTSGKVYALDIAPAFVEHMRERAQGLDQVDVRLCAEDSIELPPNSINLAFICDVYHHFEYPMSSLESIHSALRPGGQLIIIDFERIPGVTREWVLSHVRAGRETFSSEIEDAGFAYMEEVTIDRFSENYFLKFRKK